MLKNWLKRKLEAAVETPTHTKDGKQKGDPRALEWPLGLRRPPTLQEQIKAALASQAILQRQQARGEESLEDSMDFGPEEDGELEFGISPHEMRDLQEDGLRAAADIETRKKRRDAISERRRQDEEKRQPKGEEKAAEQPKGKEQGESKPEGAAKQ